jgi:hypothetical protein
LSIDTEFLKKQDLDHKFKYLKCLLIFDIKKEFLNSKKGNRLSFASQCKLLNRTPISYVIKNNDQNKISAYYQRRLPFVIYQRRFHKMDQCEHLDKNIQL